MGDLVGELTVVVDLHPDAPLAVAVILVEAHVDVVGLVAVDRGVIAGGRGVGDQLQLSMGKTHRHRTARGAVGVHLGGAGHGRCRTGAPVASAAGPRTTLAARGRTRHRRR